MESKIYHIFDLCLFLSTASIHLFGIYYLITISKVISRNQKLYLISLSASEVLLSLKHVLGTVITLAFPSQINSTWYEIIDIVHFDGTWIINLSTMILLTLDRFAEVSLNLRYNIYITNMKTTIAIIFLWMIGIVTAILFVLLVKQYNVDYFDVSYRYIYPALDTAVVVNAVVVYTYIYIVRCRMNKSVPKFKKQTHQAENIPNENSMSPKIKRSFYAPIIIVITYLVFLYIPDVVHFSNFEKLNHNQSFKRISTVLYSINMICDACVYIFFQPRFIRFMYLRWRKCRQIRQFQSDLNSTNQTRTSC